VTFDDVGNIYIAESGYIYGEFKPIPRILKVDENGNATVFLDRMLNAPITDIEYYNGKIYVSHRGMISAIDKNGIISDIIVGLSSLGDHHNNQIAFGKDGRLYFGQGVKTNSGVVGEDNAFHGWLKTVPREHDTPCQDITLTGQNFTSANPLTPYDKDDTVNTGAFMSFGNTASDGQKVRGDIKCNGAILSANPDGSDIKLEAWGLRNPFGLAFNSEGRLFATDNGADERGSRPIANDNDKFHEINLNETAFYGWPDYFGNAEPVTDPKFKSATGNQPLQFLMSNHPPVEKPLSLIDKYAGVTQFDFSTNSNFGYEGMAFAGK
jgi:glucose/arabinose dehydrogenase